jgi:glycopeptide antibiotics resistance protein
MIRWLLVIFLALVIFSTLLPWLEKLGIGRVPGDIRFRLFGHIVCLPFGSALLWNLAILAIAKLL